MGRRVRLSAPLVLVRDGEVNARNLRRSGLTRSDLDAILRRHGHVESSGVALAVSEKRGVVSVVDKR